MALTSLWHSDRGRGEATSRSITEPFGSLRRDMGRPFGNFTRVSGRSPAASRQDGRKGMLRSVFACSSAMVLAGLLAGGSSPAAAQDAGMCNPVVDSRGNPVQEAAGDVVTHSGSFPCPPKEEVAVEEEVVTEVRPAAGVDLPEQETVYFAFDLAEIDEESATRLEQLVGTIQSGGDDIAGVSVAGHADRAGPSQYNVGLSERRAQNVAAELVKVGIPARIIQTEGFGESQPAVATEDGAPLQANRRAVIDLSY